MEASEWVEPTAPELEWGVVPTPVVRLLERLQEKASGGVQAMRVDQIADATPRDHDEAFRAMSAAVEAANRASHDYRKVFNAYTHKFHQPRPPIGEIAKQQGTITQGFAKRYSQGTVAAIATLLSDAPDIRVVERNLRSLDVSELWGLSDAMDAALANINAPHEPQTGPLDRP